MTLSLARPACALAMAMGLAGSAAAQNVTFSFAGTITAADVIETLVAPPALFRRLP
jgi:hypothetical protein